MKKYFLITIWVLLAAVIGAAAYFGWRFIFQPAAKPITAPAGEIEPEFELAKKLEIISSESASDFWINRKTNEVYYLNSAGGIRKISANGQETKINSQIIKDRHSVQPSSDGSKAIISFGYPFKTTFAVFNAADNTWLPLPAKTASAAWDPKSNSRIIYLKNDDRAGSISFFNIADQKSKEVIKLAAQDLELEWVLPNVVYLKEKPSAEIATSLWALDLNQKTLKAIIKDESGLAVKWTPDGNLGLKLNSDGLTNSLKLISKENRNLFDWSFVIPPSKCVLGNSFAYCAVTNNLPPRARLPDDYLKTKFFSDDWIYSLDFNSGNSELVFVSDQAIDAEKLELIGNQLYFINRYDQRLYLLKL